MKCTVVSLLALMTVFLVACGPSSQKQSKKIAVMEKSLVEASKGMLNKQKAIELINVYQGFASSYPADTLTPVYLFKMAELQMQAVSPQEAILSLDRIRKEYPEFRKAPECLFLKGFIYENNLNDLNKARRYYNEFLEKYPNHYFAKDAKVLIQNLGKSPEELVKEFEAKKGEGKK